MDLASLTYETAKALEGARLRVDLPNGTVVSLCVDEVRALETRAVHPARADRTPRRNPFALYFRGPRTPILPQAIYAFRGDTTAFEQLFIVPVGQTGESTQYEAVFT
jgi:uncharacterized protein DUF6916